MAGLKDQSTPEMVEALGEGLEKPKSKRSSFGARLILFALLVPLWLVLSGRFDVFHLTLGLISCAIVCAISGDLIPELKGNGLVRAWARFLMYLPWLIWQIWLANLHILRISFHPKAKEIIDPQVIRFRSSLKSDLAKLTLANSITLTPGTITISISVYGDFRVHAIDLPSAEGILTGTMERRVKKAFGEA